MTGFSYPSGFTAGRAKAGSTGLQPPTGLSYSGATRLFSGQADPGATVTASKDGSIVGNATADGSGNWSYLFTTAPAAGSLLSARQSLTLSSADSGTITVPAANPTLNALSLSASSFAAGAAAGSVIGAIAGATAGSTLAIAPADARIAVSGANLVTGPTAASVGNFDVTIRETLAGATNSPRDTILTLTVTAAGAGPFPGFAPMLFRIAADDAANAATAIDQSFAPSAVDIGNGKIALPDLSLGAPTSAAQAAGVWVYFSTTGTLPAPLQPATPYYAAPASGGGYKIYPLVSGSDWQTIPGAIADEDQGPAQNYQQLVNALVFTAQGSGTHRLYTDPLAAQLADLSGNGYHAIPPVTGNKNFHAECPTDAGGRPYFRSRVTTRDQALASYVMHGKHWRVPTAARTKLHGARSVVHMATLTFRNRDWRSLSKWQQASTTFDTTTGVIARATHGWPTGLMVKFYPWAGSTIPAGLTAGAPYYCRSASSGTLTMHPTAADATNNTNIIIPTNQGSGTVTMVAVQYPGDIERYRQLIEHYRPADATKNALTVFTDDGTGSTMRLDMTTRFYPSGNVATNCRMGGSGVSPNRFGSPFKVRLQIPADSVGPTCEDTGLSLASGQYWTTEEPGATAYTRYHRTEADALFCAGKANNLLGSQVIRFTAPGSGWFLWETADNKAKLQSFIDAATPDLSRITIGQKLVMAVVVDMNDPASVGARIKVYINGTLFSDVDCDGASGRPSAPKGLFDSTSNAGIAATIFNSTQGHVALEADVYDILMGASTGAVTAGDLAPVTNWMMTRYGVSA